MATERLVTPFGDLKWVFITGNGKKDLNDNDRFVASVAYPTDSPEAKSLTAKINAFWDANKGKGWKRKSTGMSTETVLNKETEEREPTGNTIIQFWTGTKYPDGKAKVIKTMNARGVEVSLGSTRVGNGSKGAISGTMAIYDNGIAARGVTLYLNAVQIKKLVPYTDDAGFEVAEVEDDDFTGADEDTGFQASDPDEDLPHGAGVGTPKVTL